MLLQLSHFTPFFPLYPAHPLLSAFPPSPQLMSMGRTYKFFGFYTSYTIVNLPLKQIGLFYTYHLCFLFPVPFPSFPSSPLITLHVISISVILFLFQFPQLLFLFFFLGSVVDSCEFVVILLFIALMIFFFLDKFFLTFYIIRAS